jgi:hypothetical protein
VPFGDRNRVGEPCAEIVDPPVFASSNGLLDLLMMRNPARSSASLGETTAIDLKRVREKIGAQGRASLGSAELLEQAWGVRPGAAVRRDQRRGRQSSCGSR